MFLGKRSRQVIWMALALAIIAVFSRPERSLAQTVGPEALVDGFVRAWNMHDMKAFGRLFTENADWVSVAGIWVKGRARIQAEHEEVHATVFKTSTLASTGTEVRLLRPDVAVIHFNWELTGQLDREGKPRGSRRGIVTIVATKQADGWRISAGQNTNALPPTVAQAQVNSPDTHDHRRFQCLEDGLKSNKFGCLLLGKKEVARFPEGALFWHLNKFPTREAAEAAEGQTGMVVEAEKQFWLFSFGPKGAVPKQGKHVASVGPLPLTSDKLPPATSYEIVAYLAVMPPKEYTGVHTHPGPEAWYVLAGKQCLETPAGVMKVRAGEGMFAPPTTPMRLTNNGSSIRRALFLVIHDAAQPWNIPTGEWKPAGACDR